MDEKVAEMESLRDDEIFKSLIAKLTDAFAKEKQAAQQSTPGGRTDIACQQLRVPGAKSNLICADCIYTTSTIPIQSVNTINYIAQPILKTLWDQSAPYNNYQPEAGCNNVGFCGKSSKYNAGCVPISEGQVVAHYFAKKNTSWQTIINKVCQNYTSVEADNVAQLSSTIFSIYSVTAGASRDCNSTTVITGSSDVSHATPIGISPIFGLVQGEWRGWNTNDIRNSLSQNSPVVIKGWVGLDCFIWCWGIGAGHQWVIDGMRDLGVQTTYQVTGRYQGSACTAADLAYSSSFTYTTSYTTSTQIHQNWGWGPGYGSDPNDWYAQDYFKSYGHANYIIAYITAL